tara:strand:- start:1391 stop:2611 length:1221 start_codon:yes stop_codon:yes gene_type:complete
MANWKKVIVSGSAAELASLQLDTALPVAQGGLGASSLTDKAVLISQDSGTDAVGSLALTTNGSIIVGGTNGPAVEAASDVAGTGLTAVTGDGTLVINVDASQTQITSVGTLGAGTIASGFGNIDNGTSTLNTGNATVDILVNDSTVAASKITGSFTGSFVGDGNSLDLSTNSTIGSNIFSTVAVGGQTNIVADSNSDTLTFASSSDGLKITTNAGSDTVTFDLDANITSVQSILNTGLVIGRASSDTTIDFTSDDVIVFDAGNAEKMRVDSSGVDITGALTVSTNATIQGDLVVNGSTTTLSTTNLAVGDQFIFAATGSAGANVDAGLVVQHGAAVDTGSAFYHDIQQERWAVSKTVASNAVAVTPLQFVSTVKTSTASPTTSDGDYGVGEMWVDTDDQEIYIRTA